MSQSIAQIDVEKWRIIHLDETTPAEFLTWLRRTIRHPYNYPFENGHVSFAMPEIDDMAGHAIVRTIWEEKIEVDGRVVWQQRPYWAKSFFTATKTGRSTQLEVWCDSADGFLADHWRYCFFQPLVAAWPEALTQLGVTAVPSPGGQDGQSGLDVSHTLAALLADQLKEIRDIDAQGKRLDESNATIKQLTATVENMVSMVKQQETAAPSPGGQDGQLDYLEKKIKETYDGYLADGIIPTDEEIGAKLPRSPKGEKYSRGHVNRLRNKMRQRGIKV